MAVFAVLVLALVPASGLRARSSSCFGASACSSWRRRPGGSLFALRPFSSHGGSQSRYRHLVERGIDCLLLASPTWSPRPAGSRRGERARHARSFACSPTG